MTPDHRLLRVEKIILRLIEAMKWGNKAVGELSLSEEVRGIRRDLEEEREHG